MVVGLRDRISCTCYNQSRMKFKDKTNIALALSVIAIALSVVALTQREAQPVPMGPDAFYLAQADEAGIREKTFEECLVSPEIAERIQTDTEEVMALGGQGTPFNVVATADGNFITVAGAYPYEAFADIIDRSLEGTLTEEEKNSGITAEDFRQFDPEVDYYKGSADAPITIYEWSDYECPYCSRVHPELQRIVDTYPNVKWVYRNFPLSTIHPQAEPAAKAALCIGKEEGNEAFWNFTDTVFEDQSVLRS